MPRSFSLGDHFERLVDRLVKNGRYNNASEVLREGLRALEDREREREKSVADLRRLVEESDQEGGGAPAETVRKRLLAGIARRSKSRRS